MNTIRGLFQVTNVEKRELSETLTFSAITENLAASASVGASESVAPEKEKGPTFEEDFQKETFEHSAKDPFPPELSYPRFSPVSTPTGQITVEVSNPDLLRKFSVGDKFYIDFTPVE